MQSTNPNHQSPLHQIAPISLPHSFILHISAILLLVLHLYVRTLPATPQAIPEPSDAESAWWGFWTATYLPVWAVWVGSLLVVGLIILSWKRIGGETSRQGDTSPERSQKRVTAPNHVLRTTHYALPAISLTLFIGFLLFPIVHTRWGDAYILAKGIAYPDPLLRTVYSWQAPLDVFLHSQTWRWFGAALGATDDATPIYRLLSPLAGAIYLAIVLQISRDRSVAPAWLTFGLLSSLGLLQLFFGYIENYSFAAAGVLAYLWLGIGVIRNERPLWLAATALAITNAIHPSTVVLAPSLLYLGWGEGVKGGRGERGKGRKGSGYSLGGDKVTGNAIRNSQFAIRNSQFAIHYSPLTIRNSSPLSIVLQVGLPMILVASGTILLMEMGGHGLSALFSTDRPGGGDASWFVPLWQTTTRWQHYTLFSWLHLRDWLNGQMLVAPAVGIVLLVSSVMGNERETWRQEDKATGRQGDRVTGGGYPLDKDKEGSAIHKSQITNHKSQFTIRKFLWIATIFYLLFTWVWNPDYGGQRDWDLFSLATLPMTLLLIVWLPTRLTERTLWAGMMPLITLQALHTTAWIYQNTLPWEWPK